MSAPRRRGHSRRSSHHRQDSNPVVTQSFESLRLAETAPAYNTGEYPTYPPAFTLPLTEGPPFVPDVPDMSHYYEMSNPPQGYPGGSAHGYTYPTTEVPLSRSLSGHSSHMLPASILPSSLEEFADAGSDIRRQRSKRLARSRRQHKTRTRKAGRLPPGDRDNQGSSLAGEMSSSIDSLTAHHASAHGGPGYPYTSPDPNRSAYAATTSSNYDYPSSLYNTNSAYTHSYTASSQSEPYRPEPRHPRPTHDVGQSQVVVSEPRRAQCWDHGCNGRSFSTFSNLLRHQREKSGTSSKSTCPRCGAEFTRKTARDGHMAQDKCRGGRKQAH